MKKTGTIVAACMCATASVAGAVTFDTNGREIFRDKDWNVAFYDNAGMPVTSGKDPSVAWKTEEGNRYLQFHLDQGDKGRSKSDNLERSRAPYWERAEVKQTAAMAKGTDYVTSMRFRMIDGFEGGRETFLQIHGYNSPCNAKPAVMFKMNKSKMEVMVRRKDLSGHDNEIEKTIRTSDLIGAWNSLETHVSLSKSQPTLTVRLNGDTIVRERPLYMEDCAALHHKFGIYRPGGSENQSTSRIDFDAVTVKTH